MCLPIYLLERECVAGVQVGGRGKRGERAREKESQAASLLSTKPVMGLDLRILRS